MEETEGCLLGTLRPPRLEDAGMEDCALPPEAIKEAFLKAANSIRSWGASSTTTHDDEDCIQDPTVGGGGGGPPSSSDSLIGVVPAPDPPQGPCGGGLPEVLGDELGTGGVPEEADGFDKLLGPPDIVPEGGAAASSEGACVDGLQGLNIQEEKKNDIKDDDDDEEEEKKEKPILTGAYV